jgi:Flp pilus assembly protein TadB
MPSAPRWQRERPDIRASDAERERAVMFLRDKAAEGRLLPDELDERVGRAYVAVTQGELQRLVRDLPDPPFRTRIERSRRRQRDAVVLGLAGLAALRLPGLAVLFVWTVVALMLALVALIAVVAVALGPFIALLVLAVLALRRRGRHFGAVRFR